MRFREIKRLKPLERKKERKKEQLFVKDFLQIKRAEFSLKPSSVKFVNDFDGSINFHSVSFINK